jgi:hypothetical protein
MILLSPDGFYHVANRLQPKHVDPLFPSEALQFVSSSSCSLPTIGHTFSVVDVLGLELFLLLL